jgi:hypothetical protein
VNGQIFVSYRREDASYPAGRLYDRLQSRFTAEKLFMDVDSLAPGVDFVEALVRSVGGCDVLIAVIGKRWLSSSDEEGNRRLDNPEDFVRVEVATALKRGIRVIPVLVEGAPMPRSRELPDDLKALVRRNALEVSHNRFSADSERLIAAVEQVLESARVEQQRKREEQERAETEQREHEERERLEAERQQKEAQERLEAERRQREAQERLQAEQREKERLEAQRREHEEKERLEAQQREKERLEAECRQEEVQERLEAERRQQKGQKETPLLQSLANLKKRWRLLLVLGSGATFSVIAALLVVAGLIYFASRASHAPPPQTAPVAAMTPSPPVSIGGSSSPTPAPLAAALNSPSPTPLVSQVPPSPSPSGAEGFTEAKHYLDLGDYAKALPPLRKAADAGNAEAMNQLGELYY